MFSFRGLWLLETVVGLRCPLPLISPGEPGLRDQFLRPGHGLSDRELLDVLVELQEQKEIEFWHDGEVCVLDREAIREATFPSSETRSTPISEWTNYGLTSAGARRWEQFAEPDWGRFSEWQEISPEDDDGSIDEETTFCFDAGSMAYVEEMLSAPWRLFSREIVAASVVIEKLSPWEPTYWKTLPEGYRVQGRLGQRDFRENGLSYWDEQAKFQRWVKRTSHGELGFRQPGK